MKVYIQNSDTKKFYAGDGKWVATKEDAADCGSTLHAARIVAQDKQDAVLCVVLTFSGPRQRSIFH